MALESEHEFQGVVEHDVEKQQTVTEGKHTRSDGLLSIFAMREGEVYEAHPEKNPRWYQRLLDSGFEENGIKPVPSTVVLSPSPVLNNILGSRPACSLRLTLA